jgi:translation initiation factor 4G
MTNVVQDVIDLRKKGWETKEADKGPKTIQEVREEALKAQQEKEAASKANRSNRPQAGRGDARSFSSNNFGGMGGQSYNDHKTAGTVNSDDLKRLTSRNRQISSGPQTFGPMTLGPRGSGSRRGLGSSSRDGTNTPPVPASTTTPNPFRYVSIKFLYHSGISLTGL